MKYLIAFVPLLLTINISAQPNSELRPSFTAIIVNNIDSSIIWYGEKLGFEIVNEYELASRGVRQANLKFQDVSLELIQTSSSIHSDTVFEQNPGTRQVVGFFKIGFTVVDFDGWINHLEKVNAKFHGQVVSDAVTKKRMVIVRDPDGNRIQFFEK